ncbi:MAG: lactate racemase domain-containing protein [Spirochaetales bacterium]
MVYLRKKAIPTETGPGHARSDSKGADSARRRSAPVPFTEAETEEAVAQILLSLREAGYDLSRVLAVPPDITRFHSGSGEVLGAAASYLGKALTDVIPAVGTHSPMTGAEIARMYPAVPAELFRDHNFRTDVETLGRIEAEYIRELSEGKLEFDYPVQVSKRIAANEHGLILSIGQVVPHEVVGMANHSKNLLVGTGGAEAIDRSHYLGAVYGMERIMGVADTPVRRLLNRAARDFLGDIPVVYIQTVVAPGPDGHPGIVGLFAGDDEECFYEASALAREYNVFTLDRAPETVVVSLDPRTYRSTWLGNKAIYRTRKAIADGGRLLIHARGVSHFGEDEAIDRLIRSWGYRGTEYVLDAVARDDALADGLSAAAHLIHGSSEGRFRICYAPGGLSRSEVEAVGYEYIDLKDLEKEVQFDTLSDGWNSVNGEEIYYISQPGLGLWEA